MDGGGKGILAAAMYQDAQTSATRYGCTMHRQARPQPSIRRGGDKPSLRVVRASARDHDIHSHSHPGFSKCQLDKASVPIVLDLHVRAWGSVTSADHLISDCMFLPRTNKSHLSAETTWWRFMAMPGPL